MSSVCVEDAAVVTGRRLIHEPLAVEIDPAHVLVADPDMDVWRLEYVLSGVHHESELPLCHDGWHQALPASPPLPLVYRKRYIASSETGIRYLAHPPKAGTLLMGGEH